MIKVQPMEVTDLLMGADYAEFVLYIINDEVISKRIDHITSVLWQVGIICCEGHGKYTR